MLKPQIGITEMKKYPLTITLRTSVRGLAPAARALRVTEAHLRRMVLGERTLGAKYAARLEITNATHQEVAHG